MVESGGGNGMAMMVVTAIKPPLLLLTLFFLIEKYCSVYWFSFICLIVQFFSLRQYYLVQVHWVDSNIAVLSAGSFPSSPNYLANTMHATVYFRLAKSISGFSAKAQGDNVFRYILVFLSPEYTVNMCMQPLPKEYNFAEIERKWQQKWEEMGIYHYDWNDTKRESVQHRHSAALPVRRTAHGQRPQLDLL